MGLLRPTSARRGAAGQLRDAPRRGAADYADVESRRWRRWNAADDADGRRYRRGVWIVASTDPGLGGVRVTELVPSGEGCAFYCRDADSSPEGSAARISEA